ncbi:glycosyltransferase family 4 protein [Azospirillum sp. sgz302134]
MHIVHAGASPTPNQVNGLNQMVWTVARHQARMGHRVELVLTEPPDPDGIAAARDGGMTLIQAPPLGGAGTAALGAGLGFGWWLPSDPDVLHTHSVFIPSQAMLCAAARRRGVPYVVTPNGGVNANILDRGRLKKGLYSGLVERPRFQGASALVAVTPMEEGDIRAFVPGYRGAIACVHNPIDPEMLTAPAASPTAVNGRRPRLVYMGRLDIAHKGIDLLLDIARRLPECDLLFHSDAKALPDGLALPANARLCPPVYGNAKIQALRDADLYLQTSRWEAFGISVAEAMALGLPCAITETMSLAPILRSGDLGLVLPFDAAEAAERVRRALASLPDRERWSRRSRLYATELFSPNAVAQSYLQLYEAVSGTARLGRAA